MFGDPSRWALAQSAAASVLGSPAAAVSQFQDLEASWLGDLAYTANCSAAEPSAAAGPAAPSPLTHRPPANRES